MAEIFTNRAAIADNVDNTIFVTPAFTPSGDAGILVALWNSKATTPDLGSLNTPLPSWLTGAGWSTELDLVSAGAVRRLTVFSGFTVASPGSDLVTATFGATQSGCVIVVDEVTGQDATDFVLQPIVENEAAGTSASITLASGLAGIDSAIWSACGINGNEAQAPTGGETELADVGTNAPITHLQTQFEINDTISSVSWTSSFGQVTIGALEVKAASAVISKPGRIYKRFFGPAHLASTAADLYTVPAGARATIRHIHASNPSGSPVDFTLSIGNDAASTRLWDGHPIQTDEPLQHFRDHTLATGDKIQAFAGSANVITLTVDGYEEIL